MGRSLAPQEQCSCDGHDGDVTQEHQTALLAFLVVLDGQNDDHEKRCGCNHEDAHQMDAHRQTCQVGDQEEVLGALRPAGILQPEESQPEEKGENKRAQREDIGFDAVEPEGIAEGQRQSTDGCSDRDAEALDETLRSIR